MWTIGATTVVFMLDFLKAKTTMEQCSEILIRRGLDLLTQPRRLVFSTGNDAADQLLSNIDETPHAFVLACLMDRQIPSERAWQIPYKVGVVVGDFSVSGLAAVGLDDLTKIFEEQKLHWLNRKMAKVFYLAVEHIQHHYSGDATNIWRDNPSSAVVVRRFRDFHGAGPKIATMAANILLREFKVPMSDYRSIDISVDAQIKRVFTRLGYFDPKDDESEIIFVARELNRSYPGVIDLSLWEVGRDWCRPTNPTCSKCYLNDCCPKIGVG